MSDPTFTQPQNLPPYFQRLHELFDRVLELPPDERDAEIERAAADAPELAAELRALLEHAERSDSPLDSAAVRLQGDLPLPQIPGFRLHRFIGSGGSATVYLADQEHAEFTRAVALKVVNRVFGESSLGSVREEQRILARLEHPGIARLYDSGVTSDGQHWLAMEHVEGESIVQHCNSRELSVRERIALFLPVLDAVAYAHARGIVHRDLKPANIFVTASGEPRLLDFGIAKLSDPTDPDETRTLQRALTPAYASPEQMRGGRITTASDIYSLGVVLHELLAGTLPHETEPRPALGEDIGVVLNKALRERPEERYASATAMAKDLRKVLSGAPRRLRRLRIAAAVVMVMLMLAAAWQVASRWREKRLGPELALYSGAEGSLREGAERLAKFDGLGARDSFRRATASSKGRLPDEALAWDGLARAESSLGEIGRAAEAARRAAAIAAAHADALPKHEADRLHARALAADRNWNAAIAALEASFSEQPERVDIGLDLVSTLLACGRTDAADTALGRLRQIAAAGDPRIDLIDAEVALQLSEFQRAAAAASRAREGAARVQAVALDQRAARMHADALARLDRREEARRELTAIAARNRALGLTREAAAAELALGPILIRTASNDEARRVIEAALAGCTRAGDRRCAIIAQAMLGNVAGKARQHADGIRSTRAALADARAIGDRWAEGYVLSQLFTQYNWANEPVEAAATIEPMLAALRDSGNRQTLMATLANVAILSIEALKLEKAEAYIAEAEGLVRRVGSQLPSASIDRGRAYLEETRGDFDLARKSYTSALEKARRAGVPMSIANYLSDLAWLELADDQPVAAAQRAQEAIAGFTAVGDTRTALTTEGVLAWSEARRGDGAAAQRRLAKLRQAAAEDGSESARFDLLKTEADVAAASGDWRRAIELRRQTVRMATDWDTRGLVIAQQVRLAEALHGAGERRALEQLVAEMLPEVERHGLRGFARELRTLVAR